MQRIFFIKNGKLDKINDLLYEGWTVKIVQPVSEIVSAGGEGNYTTGDVFAYIVLEK